MIIYLLTCKVNGLKYVGQSEVPLDERWAKHVACSRCPRSKAYKLMPVVRAIAEHGPENFDRQVLEECETYEQMDAEEIRLIAELDTMVPSGYNKSKGGDAPMRGRKHTSESIEKMRQAKLNMSAETRAAISAGQARANKNPETRARKSKAAKEWIAEKGFTEEHRAKISAANSGEKNAFHGKLFGRSANPTPHTDEAKKKMSAAHTGKKLSEEHKAAISRGAKGKTSPNGLNRRPVHVYENEIHVVSYFRLEFVAEDMGVNLKTLRRWIHEGRTFEKRRYVLDVNTISMLRKGMK